MTVTADQNRQKSVLSFLPITTQSSVMAPHHKPRKQALGWKVDACIDQHAGNPGADGGGDDHARRGHRPDRAKVRSAIEHRKQHTPERAGHALGDANYPKSYMPQCIGPPQGPVDLGASFRL
ncbi:hypothetical protein E4191_19525 (plasmid) [Paracoccus liaowanqingii]|uniref:Uncharacterized protein n=1 Tax=Paracoccus liaowanqingii TaxID=2560053 RepID=A0A4Y5SS58_9RHOB|nr:hypothetical protein [Paracoccus liaowanqingii]QDA36301.1 hypothetical protein E4191_19525 [Paracoccus liaowanqingii]